MFIKTKIIVFSLISVFCVSCFMFHASCLPVQAETIAVENPLEYDNVNKLSEQIRSYLIKIVGGIAIAAIAVSGILYIIGGATMNENMVNISKKAFV